MLHQDNTAQYWTEAIYKALEDSEGDPVLTACYLQAMMRSHLVRLETLGKLCLAVVAVLSFLLGAVLFK